MNIKNIYIADIYKVVEREYYDWGMEKLKFDYLETGVFYHIKVFNKDLFINLETKKTYKIKRKKIGDMFISTRSIKPAGTYFETGYRKNMPNKVLVKKLASIAKNEAMQRTNK